MNFVVNQTIKMRFRSLRMGGKTVKSMRCAIFDSMLQFTPKAQEGYPSTKVTSIVNRDVPTASSDVWVAFFKLFGAAFHLVLQLAFFQFVVFVVARGAPKWVAVMPFVIIFVNLVLLGASEREQIKRTNEGLQADEGWNGACGEYAEMRDVVTGFRKGAVASKTFSEAHTKANTANFHAAEFEEHVMFAAVCTSMLVITILFLVLGQSAVDATKPPDERLQIGTMLALVNGVRILSGAFDNWFEALYSIVGGRASVERVAMLLNADTRRKMLWRGKKRREEGWRRLRRRERPRAATPRVRWTASRSIILASGTRVPAIPSAPRSWRTSAS